jgi:hypothetical protein
MASTQRTRPKRPASNSADSPREPFLALMRGAARTQIAACSAAAEFLAGWAQAADRFAQTVGEQLLPRTATDHFDARLARVPIDK